MEYFSLIESVFDSVNADKDKQEGKEKASYAKKGARESLLCNTYHRSGNVQQSFNFTSRECKTRYSCTFNKGSWKYPLLCHHPVCMYCLSHLFWSVCYFLLISFQITTIPISVKYLEAYYRDMGLDRLLGYCPNGRSLTSFCIQTDLKSEKV